MLSKHGKIGVCFHDKHEWVIMVMLKQIMRMTCEFFFLQRWIYWKDEEEQ